MVHGTVKSMSKPPPKAVRDREMFFEATDPYHQYPIASVEPGDFDDVKRKAFLGAIESGLGMRAACGLAMVDIKTVGKELNENDGFRLAYARAEAEGDYDALKMLKDQAPRDYRAAAEYLKTRDRAEEKFEKIRQRRDEQRMRSLEIRKVELENEIRAFKVEEMRNLAGKGIFIGNVYFPSEFVARVSPEARSVIEYELLRLGWGMTSDPKAVPSRSFSKAQLDHLSALERSLTTTAEEIDEGGHAPLHREASEDE